MNKRELVLAVSRKTGCSARMTDAMVDAVFDTIAEQLAAGQDVKIVGFGKFDVQRRSPRVGRDINRNAPVSVPERYVPRFSAGKPLLIKLEERSKRT